MCDALPSLPYMAILNKHIIVLDMICRTQDLSRVQTASLFFFITCILTTRVIIIHDHLGEIASLLGVITRMNQPIFFMLIKHPLITFLFYYKTSYILNLVIII